MRGGMFWEVVMKGAGPVEGGGAEEGELVHQGEPGGIDVESTVQV